MIEIIQGDITQSTTQAIVNAANEELILGSGVAGAILRSGGESIQKECDALAPIHEGEAVITGAGDLPSEYVIHAVAPNGETEGWEALIVSCGKEILRLCEENRIESVAIPALGTGVFGLPTRRVAELLIRTCKAFPTQNLKRIQFVLFDEESFMWFNNLNTEEDIQSR
ncbi:RNase III inhibitor [Coraliomargarita sinensis]|uniref:RNase III inhibitor n=1 Tax=Coraliomargarita sinensis TaxID=2174842 RepID=A0A317ZG03_9BACT|nr:macro domain-containing protein [Coraliomargarita sinensis]PXA02868.1 RNase III inhibitor [Coraliomargarita sinensis]